MIEKVSPSHSKVLSTSSNKNGGGGNNKKDNSGERRPRQSNPSDHGKDENEVSLLEILELLNKEEYYQSKGISFSLKENHDCHLIFVFNHKGEVIQRMEPSQAKKLFWRLKRKAKDIKQFKGGILNING